MSPGQIDRVFGCGRLRMVTGEHVEVFREAVLPGERRRYTKRFLNSTDGDFAHWTEREWRILARLIGHGVSCVPDVVQFDRGSVPGAQIVQTYDAGVTVDQWATLLPLLRGGRIYHHAFEDCAHWWALAHHCLVALKEIHQLQLVHLDIKGDNVCIPLAPANFDPEAPGHSLHPLFAQLALIDFAFALVSGENLTAPLPIGRQMEYDYQSPRLLAALEAGHGGDLRPTRELDWRCDIYSLTAMLGRYLPDDRLAYSREMASGWTSERHDAAKGLLQTLRDHHDREAPQHLPHPALIDLTGARLRESDLALSLASGWTLARDFSPAVAVASPVTPMTRIAPPIRVYRKPRERTPMTLAAVVDAPRESSIPLIVTRRDVSSRLPSSGHGAGHAVLAGVLAVALGAAVAQQIFPVATRGLIASAQSWFTGTVPLDESTSAANAAEPAREEPAAPDTARGEPTASDTALDEPAAANTATAQASAAQPVANADAAEDPQPPSASATPDDTPPRLPNSRSNSRAASPQSEIVRNASKRSPAKSPPASLARSAPSAASPKTPPARPATPARRASPPMTGSNPRTVSAASSGVPPRIETTLTATPTPTPVIAAQLVPQQGEAARAEPSPPSAPQPAETIPTPNPVVSQATQPSSTQDSSPPATPKSPAPARRARTPSAADDWRTGISVLSQLFGLTKRKAAPIEDRALQDATPPAKPARAPQPPAPAPDQTISASPKVEAPQLAASGNPPPPAASSRATIPEARAEIRPPYRARESDFAMQARRTLAQSVPRMAVQAQTEVAHVLWAAANAVDPRQERHVVDYAQAIWVRDSATGYSQTIESTAARRLNDEAMQAYGVRRNITEAFDLALRAFGANPGDPEIAGNLAFLHLRLSPAQPELARQLALHAIAIRGSRFRTGRLEDWNTYALASALTGRVADARNAMYVTLALAGSVDRNCKAGLTAITSYGDRVREPVEAMLYRIYTQGRAAESPYCAWPPSWAVGMRRQ